MAWAAKILVLLVAVEHVWFFILESFLWTKPLGLKTFRMSMEKALMTRSLAANQGLYNSFLAAGLVWGLLHPNPEVGLQIQTFFLVCVVVAGVVGSFTAMKQILFIQGIPAGLALLFLFLSR